MLYLKWTGKSFQIFALVLCLIICSAYPAFGQPDSLRNKIVDDSLLRIADSLFRIADSVARQMQGTKQPIQWEDRRGADYSDVVSWRDIARQDSLARLTKKQEPRVIPFHKSPVQERFERILDSLHKVWDTSQLQGRIPADSSKQNSPHPPKFKINPTPDSLIKGNESPRSDRPSFKQFEKPSAFFSSPAPDTDFLALGDNNTYYPPDVSGAAGLNHLMVTLNTQVRIQDRQGREISTVLLDNWWAPTGATFVFDPRILFDPYKRRWIFVACSNPSSANSSLLIAISQTTDPTGQWYRYRIDIDAQNILWADYPSLGFNKKWICVNVNMYTNSWQGHNIYTFRKDTLYAGRAPSFRLFTARQPLTFSDFNPVPAVTYNDTLSTLYLIRSGFDSTLETQSITGGVGNEVLNSGPSVNSNLGGWWYGYTAGAPQLGTTCTIQLSIPGTRMQNVVYRDGALYCVHRVFLPRTQTGPNRSSAQWWKLYALGGLPNISVLQQGRIEDATNIIFYAYPSITANMNSDLLIGHSRFSSGQYASGNYSFRTAVDPPNSMQPDTILKDGDGTYCLGGSPARWGDYTTTMADPLNDFAMWTIQEYAVAQIHWGTWWGRIGDLHCPVSKGDLDLDAYIGPPDIVKLLLAAFANGTFPAPFCTADIDCNRSLTKNDTDLLLNFVFVGEQHPACGYQY